MSICPLLEPTWTIQLLGRSAIHEGVENTLDQTNGSVGMVVTTSAPPYFNGYIRWNIDGREHVRPDQRVGYETTSKSVTKTS